MSRKNISPKKKRRRLRCTSETRKPIVFVRRSSLQTRDDQQDVGFGDQTDQSPVFNDGQTANTFESVNKSGRDKRRYFEKP